MEIKLNGKKVKVNKETKGVYVVWVDNFAYIGSGKVMDRKEGNLSKLRRNVHANKQLQEQYNIHKVAKFELLDLAETDEEARVKEQYYINYFKKVDGVAVCNKKKASNGATSKAYNKHKKLTEDKVRQIKILLKEHKEQHDGKVEYRFYTELAKEFDCSENTIGKIARGERWTSVNI